MNGIEIDLQRRGETQSEDQQGDSGQKLQRQLVSFLATGTVMNDWHLNSLKTLFLLISFSSSKIILPNVSIRKNE